MVAPIVITRSTLRRIDCGMLLCVFFFHSLHCNHAIFFERYSSATHIYLIHVMDGNLKSKNIINMIIICLFCQGDSKHIYPKTQQNSCIFLSYCTHIYHTHVRENCNCAIIMSFLFPLTLEGIIDVDLLQCPLLSMRLPNLSHSLYAYEKLWP